MERERGLILRPGDNEVIGLRCRGEVRKDFVQFLLAQMAHQHFAANGSLVRGEGEIPPFV